MSVTDTTTPSRSLRSSGWKALRRVTPRLPWAEMADHPEATEMTRAAAKLFDGLAVRHGTLVAARLWKDMLDYTEAFMANDPAILDAFFANLVAERTLSYRTALVAVVRLWVAIGTRVERQRMTREASR